MLYKFKSKAAGDVIMLGPNGDQMLRIIGREPPENWGFNQPERTITLALGAAAWGLGWWIGGRDLGLAALPGQQFQALARQLSNHDLGDVPVLATQQLDRKSVV